MKSKDKIKVLLRYEYLDVHHLERMLYVVFFRNGNLYFINDKASIITEIDDEHHSLKSISARKAEYLKYNSEILTLKKLNKMLAFLKIMDSVHYISDFNETVKSIKRSLKIRNLLK